MDKPIRILHVFGRLDRGGAETMVMNLYRNVNRNAIQFDFIVHTNEDCDYDDEIKFLGGKIYRVPCYNGKNHFQYKKAWNNFFQEHSEHKIIHAHVRSTASIFLKIAKKFGLITIAHSHNTSSGRGASAIVKNTLQYPIRYIADYLFACSKVAGEWLYGKKACEGENYFLLNNAIDSDKYIFDEEIRLTKRKELQIENKFTIGHVGRFHPQKNHSFLIDIFKEVYNKNKNSVLLLVGDGELKKSIQKKVKSLDLSNNVIFAGVSSEVAELLQAMDVFLFPSLHEGLPVTLIEAQAAGLPCIVSDRITNEIKITELITFVPLTNTPKQWASEVLYYGENFKRKSQHSQIIKAGYDIKTTTKALEKFYLMVNRMNNRR